MLLNIVAVDVTLKFVRQQDIDQVTLLSSFCSRDGFETVADGEIIVGSAWALADKDVAATVAKVLSLSMALASITDDGNCLALEET